MFWSCGQQQVFLTSFFVFFLFTIDLKLLHLVQYSPWTYLWNRVYSQDYSITLTKVNRIDFENFHFPTYTKTSLVFFYIIRLLKKTKKLYDHFYEEGLTVSRLKNRYEKTFNPLSANITKWSNTLQQFVGKLPTNCLSAFDHFVGLALKGLTIKSHRISQPRKD